MTFDLEWANDPASGGITGSYDANVACVDGDGSLTVGTTTHHEGPGYYHANNSRWWMLLDAMDDAGLLDYNDGDSGLPALKLQDNGGWHVTADEVMAAIRSHRNHAWNALDYFKDEPSPELCVEIWNAWIQWMAASADHGGFRVY